MTMTEAWTFSRILVHPTEGILSNVIVTIEFIYALSNGKAWEQRSGTTTLSSPSPGPGFIDYENISYDDMVMLAKRGLGGDYDTMKSELTDALDNPLVPIAVPWIPEGIDDLPPDDFIPEELEEDNFVTG